jgi:uncharacterized membrane protein
MFSISKVWLMNLITLFRWLHILTGAAWLGEVVTINFVLIPTLSKLNALERPQFIRSTFPRLFRLASLLSTVSITSGLIMSYLVSGWKDLSVFIGTRWGMSILIGGSLGIALTVFHFVVESRLEPIAVSMDENTRQAKLDQVIRFLKIIPRAGLFVMITIFALMMYAAHGS